MQKREKRSRTYPGSFNAVFKEKGALPSHMCAFGVFELKWFTTYLSDIALKTEYWCLAYKSIVQSLHVGVKLAIILQKIRRILWARKTFMRFFSLNR